MNQFLQLNWYDNKLVRFRAIKLLSETKVTIHITASHSKLEVHYVVFKNKNRKANRIPQAELTIDSFIQRVEDKSLIQNTNIYRSTKRLIYESSQERHDSAFIYTRKQNKAGSAQNIPYVNQPTFKVFLKKARFSAALFDVESMPKFRNCLEKQEFLFGAEDKMPNNIKHKH